MTLGEQRRKALELLAPPPSRHDHSDGGFPRQSGQRLKGQCALFCGRLAEFMSTGERMRVMLEWFGRRQTIALPINSVVGCLIATILLMILSENNVRTLTRDVFCPWRSF